MNQIRHGTVIVRAFCDIGWAVNDCVAVDVPSNLRKKEEAGTEYVKLDLLS